MIELVIIGAGGFAREVLDIVDAINDVEPTYEMSGFLVETPYYAPGVRVRDIPVLGDLNWIADRAHEVAYVIAVGDPAVRLRIATVLDALGARASTLVHPAAILTRWVNLQPGTIITAGCILTNEIQIGQHVHVNLRTTIGHDSSVDSFSTLSPGVCVSGNVTLGEGTFVGTGANIMERIAVGEWARVGAGSTVLKDVPANSTVIGTPAKVVRQRLPGWHFDGHERGQGSSGQG